MRIIRLTLNIRNQLPVYCWKLPETITRMRNDTLQLLDLGEEATELDLLDPFEAEI